MQLHEQISSSSRDCTITEASASIMAAPQDHRCSQLGADEFVLSLFSNRAGFFVDVGAADGQALSNTAQLEARGWSGVAVDPLVKNFESRHKTRCFKAVVYSHADQEVEFAVCSQDPNLSGITQDLCSYRQHVLGNAPQVAKFKTVLLSDLLDSVQAPRMIEYMSLDTEGSELAILSTFPFDRYTFGVITVEHNFEEPKRGQMRQLLEHKGYVLAAAVQWDDWYVHGSVAAEMQASAVPTVLTLS